MVPHPSGPRRAARLRAGPGRRVAGCSSRPGLRPRSRLPPAAPFPAGTPTPSLGARRAGYLRFLNSYCFLIKRTLAQPSREDLGFAAGGGQACGGRLWRGVVSAPHSPLAAGVAFQGGPQGHGRERVSWKSSRWLPKEPSPPGALGWDPGG